MGNKINHAQTRMPGRLDPKTAIGGQSARTEAAYHAWSATAVDIEFAQRSANHAVAHIMVAKTLQIQAVISVVCFKAFRPWTTIHPAPTIPADTIRCQ